MTTDPNDSQQRTDGDVIADTIAVFKKVNITDPEVAKNADRMVDESGTINYADKQF